MAQAGHRFPALDWLRGVAAFCVVAFHFASTSNPNLLPQGGLAVDFFFSLSGFVVPYAYEARLCAGLPVAAFMTTRLIRLYPMILVGSVIGAIGYAHSYSAETLAIAWAAALLLLPSPLASAAEGYNAVPANPPEWTLIFELYGNLLYALVAPKLTTAWLLVVIAVSLVLYEGAFWIYGPDGFGFSWPTISGGIPRFILSFSIGVALYRLFKSKTVLRSAPLLVSTAVLIGVFCVPWPPRYEWAYSSIAVVVIFPLVIVSSINVNIGRAAPACILLGELSYPVYILQGGIVPHARALALRVGHGGPFSILAVVGMALVYGVGAYGMWRFVDAPVRGFLSGRRLRFAKDRVRSPEQASLERP